MPKLKFTQSELDKYFSGNAYCTNILSAREKFREMEIHADGVFPEKLIGERRPNEAQIVKDYRKKVYEPITKPEFSRIVSSLQKIRRSSEWAIKYHNQDQFTLIAEDEDLETYCEIDFPMDYGSVTNWAFTLMLRQQLIDSNAVIFVHPLEYFIPENEYFKPFPEIFNCREQLDYREGDYAVLVEYKNCIYEEKDQIYFGDTYYFVTTAYIWKYEQIGSDRSFRLTVEYEHGLGFLPVFKVKGLALKQINSKTLYESRIAGILSRFNEAVREYSDLQAAKVGHMYPERWEFTNNECKVCRGHGEIENPLWSENCGCERKLKCEKCEGSGYIIGGPYSKMILTPPNPLSPMGATPTPPAGYVVRDTAIIKMQDESVDKQIYMGLAAINFQFLAQTPLNQSGYAKEVDKDELNNTVHSIAEDLVAVMDKIYDCCARYRYKAIYSDSDIDDMLPTIPVPSSFDMLSNQYLLKEITDSRNAKLNPTILNEMEIDYAEKRFVDKNVSSLVELSLELDPLPNREEADKVLMLTNNGISEINYIISCNILPFMRRAMEENKNYTSLPTKKQRELIESYAQEQIDNQPEKGTDITNQIVNTDPENIP